METEPPEDVDMNMALDSVIEQVCVVIESGVLNNDTNTDEQGCIKNNDEIDNQEIVNAEIDNEEIVNAEIDNEEIVNAEIDNEEIINDEIDNEEIVNDEIDNNEIVKDKITNDAIAVASTSDTSVISTIYQDESDSDNSSKEEPPKESDSFIVHSLQYVSNKKLENPPYDKAFVLLEPLPTLLTCAEKTMVELHDHRLQASVGPGNERQEMDLECFAISATFKVKYFKIAILDGYVNDNLGKQIACMFAEKGFDVYVCEEIITRGMTKKELLPLENSGVKFLKTVEELVTTCDIICCFLPLNAGAKEVFYGSILPYAKGKDFIFFSSLDHEACADFAEAIHQLGGRYLESPICSTSVYEEGKELSKHDNCILVAGDKPLFEEFNICFLNIVDRVYFLGEEAGKASKMNLLLGTVVGIMMTAITEACSLSIKQDIGQKACLMSDLRKMLRCAFQCHSTNTTAIDTFIDEVTTEGRTTLPKNIVQMMNYAVHEGSEKGISLSVTSVALQKSKMTIATGEKRSAKRRTVLKRKVMMT